MLDGDFKGQFVLNLALPEGQCVLTKDLQSGELPVMSVIQFELGFKGIVYELYNMY